MTFNSQSANSFPSQSRRPAAHRSVSVASPAGQLDGRAPDSKQMGQPGRPFSAQRRGSVARSSTCEGKLSWVNHYQSKANCHEIQLLNPTMLVSRHSAWLQHLANGCLRWRKISGRPSQRPRCTTSQAHPSALVTNGCEAKLTRHLARWSRSCNPIKAGASSAISCAIASNRGGLKQSAPENVRRPMSSAASSCSFRFTNSPRHSATSPSSQTIGAPTSG
jgi:hypothetical protein